MCKAPSANIARTLDMNPSFVTTRKIFSQMLATRGRFDEATAISEETLRIDPQSIDGVISHGMLLYYKRDWDAAAKIVDRVLAEDPGNPAGSLLAARVAEAQWPLRRGARLSSSRRGNCRAKSASTLKVLVIRLQALSGDIDGARAARTELEKRRTGRHSCGCAIATGRFSPSGLARSSSALDAFDRAFAERDPALVCLTVDPRVDPLRSEPRFVAMLQKTVGKLTRVTRSRDGGQFLTLAFASPRLR